jgi:hypothetical protein
VRAPILGASLSFPPPPPETGRHTRPPQPPNKRKASHRGAPAALSPGPARKRGRRVSRLGGCLPAPLLHRTGHAAWLTHPHHPVADCSVPSRFSVRSSGCLYAGSSVFAFAGVCALHVSAWTRCGGQKKWGVAVFPPTCSGTYMAGDPVWCTGAHRRGQACVCGPV